jgi:hypothetical protein
MTGGAIHYVGDDLEQGPEVWASEGVAELELLLARHASFDEYLRAHGHES